MAGTTVTLAGLLRLARVSFTQVENSKVLHWNGEEKPWMDKNGPHYKLWKKHAPTECNNVGNCKAIKANANYSVSYLSFTFMDFIRQIQYKTWLDKMQVKMAKVDKMLILSY